MDHPGPARGTSLPLHTARISLRMRLTLWVLAIFMLIQFGTQAAFVLYQRANVERVFTDQLLGRAKQIASQLAPRLPDIEQGDINEIAQRELRFVRFDRFTIDVFDSMGNSVVAGHRSTIQWPRLRLLGVPMDNEPEFRRVRVDLLQQAGSTDERARAVVVGTTASSGARYAVVVATSNAYANEQLALVTRLAVVSSLVGLAAAAVSARLIAGIAVAPIERLRAMAERLGPESIGEKLEIDATNTEIARLTQELDNARARIEHGFVAKERFLTNVSHEIKTPIAVMLIEAQTLDRRGCPRAISRFIDTIEEEMARLGRLVESFLTLSRIQDGKGPAELRNYGVNDLVMDSIDNCAMMAGQHRVRLVPRFLAEEETVDTSVIGDPDLLRTMLVNLIHNAIRFSPEGAAVNVDLARTDGWVSVTVTDAGPGIPADRLRAVFDRFASVNNGTRQGRGHGLGLAIAQGIAELHGGAISAANRDARGCEFSVRLPVARTRTAHAPAARPARG